MAELRAAAAPALVSYEDAPLRPFHLRLAVSTTGGVFSDGFGIGIIGIALTAAASSLQLTPVWLGLLGAGSLAGLFFGALLAGSIVDRFGRRRMFAYNMALLAICCLLQFFVQSVEQLFVMRFLIGILLGTDYVVSKAMLVEFSPLRMRGRLLSGLSIAWAAGYAFAYFTGYALIDLGTESWRWILVSSAAPALLILALRLRAPESPLWLMAHGRPEEAAQVVSTVLGPQVAPPVSSLLPSVNRGRWKQLFTRAWGRSTLVACTVYTCQVIPYFAISTFIKLILERLNVEGSGHASLVYNLLLLIGSVLGLVIVDRIPRRAYLIGTFAITAVALSALVLWINAPAVAIIILFAVFAGTLSASCTMLFVYVPELFPTELRGSGIGIAIAVSRIGSAVGTFLLPGFMEVAGARTALGACAAVLALGGVICFYWAPETKNLRLGSIATIAKQ